MRDHGLMTKETDLASKHFRLKILMRVNIKRAKCMDKENIYGTRENTMKVNG